MGFFPLVGNEQIYFCLFVAICDALEEELG